MTPAQVAVAQRVAGQPSAAPSWPSRAPASPPAQDKPRLEVIPAPRRRAATIRRRLAAVLSLTLLSGSLMATVLAHSILAQDQVRMGKLQAELSSTLARHAADQLKVAQLEAPSRITGQAQGQHLAAGGQVGQVPSVPLSQPIAAPNVAPAPGTTTAAGAAGG